MTGYGGSSGGVARSIVPLYGNFEVTFSLSWSGRGYCIFGVVPVSVDCRETDPPGGDSWCRSGDEGDFRSTGACYDNGNTPGSGDWYVYNNGIYTTTSTGTTGSGGTFKIKRLGSMISVYVLDVGSTSLGGGDSQGTVPMNFYLGGGMNNCAYSGITLS